MSSNPRIYLIIVLVFTSVIAEKKINLDDIERDNLHAESKSSSDIQKSSYSVKPETDREDYQSSDNNYPSGGGLGAYTTAQPSHSNYNADGYGQSNAQNEADYQHDSQIQVLPKSQPTYQQQQQQQQLYYEPEVSVGNQYQAIQQKAATEKYLTNEYKNTVYIPMSQLLAYYRHLSLGQGSSSKSESLLQELASQAARQIPIPVYTSDSVSRASIYTPSKLSYQIQPQYVTYATKYPLHTQAILPTKKSVGRLYSQAGRAYTQPKELVYTQAVINQPQTQYLQELIYPTSLYTPEEPEHAKTYASAPVYVQGHSAPQTSHLAQYTTHYIQPDIQYVVPTAKNVHHNYEKNQQSPGGDFTPPQLPAQEFKPDQYSISGESDKVHYLQNYLHHSSEPKSLLDSYIPSHVIAAQDAERYRERPLKLESGFLPSKINFIHSYKKRKSQ